MSGLTGIILPIEVDSSLESPEPESLLDGVEVRGAQYRFPAGDIVTVTQLKRPGDDLPESRVAYFDETPDFVPEPSSGDHPMRTLLRMYFIHRRLGDVMVDSTFGKILSKHLGSTQ